MDKNLIQLRNYHLRRGKNNDSTPIYPITKPECIKGLVEYLQTIGISGTTSVDTLPTTGEQGKVYYNTTDNKYYIYDGDEFKEFGVTNPSIVTDLKSEVYTIEIGGGAVDAGDKYTLEPNVYYDLGNIPVVIDNTVRGIVFDVETSDDTALSYMGRFTVSTASVSVIFTPGSDIIIPDEQAEKLANLEAGHTYEFNIFANVFMISDITVTE